MKIPAAKIRNPHVDREGPIHKACLNYLRLQFPKAVITHAANESGRGGKAGVRYGSRNKSLGQMRGFPDLIMLHRGGLYTFEVKAPRNYPDDHQRAAGAAIEANGGYWAVVRSIDDVKAVLAAWEVLR